MQSSQTIAYDHIDNYECTVADDTLREIHNEIRSNNRRNRRPAVLLGDESIRDRLVRQQRVERRRRMRRCIQRNFPHSFVECCAMTSVLLTCAVFFVCVVLMMHLNNLKLIRSDPTFRIIAIAIVTTWFGSIMGYVFMVWLHEIFHS